MNEMKPIDYKPYNEEEEIDEISKEPIASAKQVLMTPNPNKTKTPETKEPEIVKEQQTTVETIKPDNSRDKKLPKDRFVENRGGQSYEQRKRLYEAHLKDFESYTSDFQNFM